MAPWFKIDTVPAERLLYLRTGGFFDLADIAEMRDELVRKLSMPGCEPNQHMTLCDISEMSIQSQEMVEQFAKLVGHLDVRSRRLAFVTGATLARLQARRLTSRDGIAFFNEETAALSWLRSREVDNEKVGQAAPVSAASHHGRSYGSAGARSRSA